MKKITVLIASALLATSAVVYADNDHQHETKGSSMATMGMSGDMQAKMAKMKADMISIQKESNPVKRKALMKAHMKKMHGSMGMMKNQPLASRVTLLEAMVEQIMVNQIDSLDPNDEVYTW